MLLNLVKDAFAENKTFRPLTRKKRNRITEQTQAPESADINKYTTDKYTAARRQLTQSHGTAGHGVNSPQIRSGNGSTATELEVAEIHSCNRTWVCIQLP